MDEESKVDIEEEKKISKYSNLAFIAHCLLFGVLIHIVYTIYKDCKNLNYERLFNYSDVFDIYIMVCVIMLFSITIFFFAEESYLKAIITLIGSILSVVLLLYFIQMHNNSCKIFKTIDTSEVYIITPQEERIDLKDDKLFITSKYFKDYWVENMGKKFSKIAYKEDKVYKLFIDEIEFDIHMFKPENESLYRDWYAIYAYNSWVYLVVPNGRYNYDLIKEYTMYIDSM